MKGVLHDVASLGMGEAVDGLAVDDHPHSHSSADCYVHQRLLDLVFAQLELCHRRSVDICIYLGGNSGKGSGDDVQDFDAAPQFLGSGGDATEEGTGGVKTQRSEGGDANGEVLLGLLAGGFYVGLCLVLVDEVYDFPEGLLGVGVGDAISALDDVEIGDFSLIVEDGLANGHIVVSASQLDPHELPLLQLLLPALLAPQVFEETDEEGHCCSHRQSYCQMLGHNLYGYYFYVGLIIAQDNGSQIYIVSLQFHVIFKQVDIPSILSKQYVQQQPYTIIQQDFMKQHSMLVGAALINLLNVYGLVLSFIFRPPSAALIVIAAASIAVVTTIEFRKRRVLLETRARESYGLFALLIVFMLFFLIVGCGLLVYLNELQESSSQPDSPLKWMLAGLDSIPITQVAAFNLPYYLGSLLFFMYYTRCFYVMFWSENIVFIYRYLRSKVRELNQFLLAYMPSIRYSSELENCICSLCLEEYKKEDRITRLHCAHVYHLDCVRVWVMRSNHCPLCRKRVIL